MIARLDHLKSPMSSSCLDWHATTTAQDSLESIGPRLMSDVSLFVRCIELHLGWYVISCVGDDLRQTTLSISSALFVSDGGGGVVIETCFATL